jgi:hypothetical protein
MPELVVKVEQEEGKDEDIEPKDNTISVGLLDSIARQADFIKLIP